MNRFLFLFIFFLLVTGTGLAQLTRDSTRVPLTDSAIQSDSNFHQKDLIQGSKIPDSLATQKVDSIHPKLQPGKDTVTHFMLVPEPGIPGTPREFNTPFAGKELLFYLLIFLLIIFALMRQAFPKYFSDLFRLFFRTTIKQRQIREQLIQTPLPSLLLNGFFVIGAGLYIAFILQHYDLNPVNNFWLLFLYCCLGLSAIYFIKFVGLKISGWLFNMEEAANGCIFIVFVVNKMIGILLLPFLVILAFSQGNIYSFGLTLSWCMIVGLLVYRFILTFLAIRNLVKVNPFHFFLYFLAFEIAPLLLIYKGLLLFFRQTT